MPAAVVAGVVWYRVGTAGSDAPSARTTERAPTTVTTRAASPSTTVVPGGTTARPTRRGSGVVVHVAGDVAHPGVVELPKGSRVIDAIEAAGGANADADLDRLNLAQKLVDGTRVLVQRTGDPAGALAPGGSQGETGSTDPSAPLDLNAATQAQLEELPGIGPTLAAAIIEERDRRGGFRSINELRDVRGIGEKRFADLKDAVTVG